MMKKYFPALFGFLFIVAVWSCQEGSDSAEGGEAEAVAEKQPVSKAQQVVDEAIAAHGAARVAHSRIEFDFRGRHYVSDREGGIFTYERIFTDTSSGDKIRDVLSNNGFYREVNGQRVALPAKDSAAYSNSVNSVLYFALLPYYLNDPAVQKEYLGETTIRGEPYDEVKITFRQEGGGKDFQDEFVYWIHRHNNTVDFMAYSYDDDGETGARFREAYHIHKVGGIRFVDYINYKPVVETLEVETFDDLYEQGQLEELSRIDTENPVVYPD
jgi:hypothetical protein